MKGFLIFLIVLVVLIVAIFIVYNISKSLKKSVKTKNIYGKIFISDSTIERFVYHISTDCYGIVRFVPTNLYNAITNFIKFRNKVKGVKVHTNGDRITIDVAIVVKYGVSIKAVVEALKESIKYKVEKFSGMIVDTMNVKVVGVDK
ncbi:MAG: Asp23/Gls24 family envelope stress response protein [Clostridia bacterium]|nr:Asp23/Gls24 family envelope stress response protein [Clostridia bacterium]